jgi:hypothetical protein
MGVEAGRNPHVVDRPRSPAPDGCHGGAHPPGGGPGERVALTGAPCALTKTDRLENANG